MKYDRYIVIAALAAIVVLSAGCTSSKPSADAMNAANVTVDRMLNAVNAGDYAAFTENFSSTMKSGTNESKFNEIKSDMTGRYGKYVSRAPAPTTTTSQGYPVFIYNCQYEKSNVTITLGMNPTNVWTVEGFYYKSA